MPAGSMMFFLGSLFHGGGANVSTGSRLGVILLYCANWLRPRENQMLAVPKEIVRDLSPKLQELLGYGIFGGFGGSADGRHPRKFLDDPREVEHGVVRLTPESALA
jgi:ectoine hydroxylase-related dioxygenase (phytanoyl-CoA dioxygenase family)